MQWEKVLRDCVKNNRIKEVHLVKIPVLKNCENWKKVEVLGYVDATLKFTSYKGVLVKLNDKIFFVSNTTMEALSTYINWNIKNKIEVYKDK